MTLKLVLFNGPPHSGKDLCCNLLDRMFNRGRQTFADKLMEHYKFADELRDVTRAIFGLTKPERFYEEHKEDQMVELMGMSWREALIHVSENIMKPMFGKDVWARRMCEQIDNHCINNDDTKYISVSDLGFDIEVDYVAKHYEPQNIFIIRLHRPNCDFKKDSRKHIENFPEHVQFTDLYNNGSLADLNDKLGPLVRKFIYANN